MDVGTGANQIVQLDGSSRLPAVDGSQLTNLPNPTAGTVLSGFVTGANSTVTNADSVEVAIEKLQGQVDASNTAISGKENTLTKGNITETTSSILTITGGTGAVIGNGVTVAVTQATGVNSGYLSSTDFTTFNNKLSPTNVDNLSLIHI